MRSVRVAYVKRFSCDRGGHRPGKNDRMHPFPDRQQLGGDLIVLQRTIHCAFLNDPAFAGFDTAASVPPVGRADTEAQGGREITKEWREDASCAPSAAAPFTLVLLHQILAGVAGDIHAFSNQVRRLPRRCRTVFLRGDPRNSRLNKLYWIDALMGFANKRVHTYERFV